MDRLRFHRPHPWGGERGAGAQSGGWVPLEQLRNELAGSAQGGVRRRYRVVLHSCDLGEEHLHVISIERHTRREEGIEDDAARPHVALARVEAITLANPYELGRRVNGRATIVRAQYADRIEIAQTKVGNLQSPRLPRPEKRSVRAPDGGGRASAITGDGGAEQQVFELKIAVADAERVAERHALEEMLKEVARLSSVKLLTLVDVAEHVTFWAVLHDE
mmetsp:Transcript_24066/g.61472  ORF Transcript_24066/g.61472 Transcript_24066/m.61472 type:complete len:219 (+) Transcript_24066:774-1430(+)